MRTVAAASEEYLQLLTYVEKVPHGVVRSGDVR